MLRSHDYYTGLPDRQDDRGGFWVTVTGGMSVYARRLLVASRLADVLTDVPGMRERWSRDVLHCAYCHCWEVQDQAIGILADLYPASSR